MKLELSPATLDDLDFMAQLRNEEASAKYSRRGALTLEQVRVDYFENSAKHPFIASLGGEQVGFVIYELLSEQEAEISVALVPAQRGKGIGVALIKAGTQYGLERFSLSRMLAEIFPANSASVRAFESAGFLLFDDGKEPWIFAVGP